MSSNVPNKRKIATMIMASGHTISPPQHTIAKAAIKSVRTDSHLTGPNIEALLLDMRFNVIFCAARVAVGHLRIQTWHQAQTGESEREKEASKAMTGWP